jgi:hypothetical protein
VTPNKGLRPHAALTQRWAGAARAAAASEGAGRRIGSGGPRVAPATAFSALSFYRDQDTMSQASVLRSPWIAAAGIVFLLCGCGGGGKGVKVEGKLVKDGQPLTAGKDEMLNLSFTGKNAQGADAVFGAIVQSDGTFVVNDVPPGKFKLHVSISGGGSEPASLKKMEGVNKEFEAGNAKLEYEVTAEAVQHITVDAKKGTAVKQ